MQRRSPIRSTPAILALLFCSALVPAAGEARSRPVVYVEPSTYLQSDADYESWLMLRHHLGRNFDDICGDSFCEGEYSNIESLRFVCSVRQGDGRIGECGWSFAASDESMAATSGAFTVTTQAWFCLAPLQPGTTIEALLAALQGEEPLYAGLPGNGLTLYEGLIDCL